MYPINNIIERHFDRKPSQSVKLTGGDINDVYHVIFQEKSVVIKINNDQSLPQFFEKEKQGLELLSKSTFIVPKHIKTGSIDNLQYLIMDHIEQGSKLNWAVFGEKLAQLHQIEGNYFGLDHNNYIGSLEQNNKEIKAYDALVKLSENSRLKINSLRMQKKQNDYDKKTNFLNLFLKEIIKINKSNHLENDSKKIILTKEEKLLNYYLNQVPINKIFN